MKNKLLVFAGKPGAGKTTIIGRLFPEKKIVDVLTFIEPFVVGGNVSPEKSMIAYQDMYQSLELTAEPEVVLEIGTNYPELNVSRLEKLLDKFEIKIFLCVLDKDTCYRRAVERGMRHCTEAFEERMNRDFPNAFVKLLEPSPLEYEIVDMCDSLENTASRFRKIIDDGNK